MNDAKESAKGFNYAAKIGSLIAMAEDETLSAEARAAYRSKAEQLMREYRIAEEETIAQDQFAIVPIKSVVTLMESSAITNPLRGHYAHLWYTIGTHAGVRSMINTHYGPAENPYSGSVARATVIGYENDIKLAEFYWTAARLVFLTRIDASPNPDLTDQENCYFLRNSGLKRNRIAAELWGSAMTDGHAHGKVQRLYLAECAKRGETPRVSGRGIQVDLYREAYASGFVQEFSWRLHEARDAADAVAGSLVLPGRQERVDEAFYEEYPRQRPLSAEERARRAKADEEYRGDAGPCKPCMRTKHESGQCREHRPYVQTEAQRAKYRRKYESAEAKMGYSAGAAAARSVQVERTASARSQSAGPAPERRVIEG